MGFFFCHGCQEGQSHLRIFLQREDTLRFKEDTHRILQICQVSNNANAVGHVSCKARYVLTDDHVKHARLSICNHLVEIFTVLSLGATDTFIGVDVNQCPVWMVDNKVLIVFLLQLIGCGLLHVIRGNTDVDDHAVFCKLVKWINLLFFWIIHIVVRINLDIHPSPGFLFCQFFLALLLDINHGGSPLHHPVQEAASSPDME